MKAKVNGIEVEGTPEEIARILGITIKDTKCDYIPGACKCCPNYGKGPCLCTIPYMTQTGWSYQLTC